MANALDQNALRGRSRYPYAGSVDPKALSTAYVLTTAITGCQLWLKADSLIGTYNDGDLVSAWLDDSGQGNDGSSAGADRPTFKVNIVNGQPVVRFSGAHQITHAPLSYPNGTYFVVWSRTNAANNDVVLIVNGAAYSYLQYADVWYAYSGVTQTVAMAAGTFFLKSCKYDGVNYSRYTNGSAEAPQAGAGAMALTLVGYNAGALNGDVAEVLAYSQALSDNDRQYVEQYLRIKYALW